MSTPYGAVPAGPTAGSPPPSNLVWAILSTIFCCVPLGVVSIVFAAQVNSKWAQGDVAGAHDSSKKAAQFAIGAAAIGVIGVVVYILFIVAGVASGL